MTEISMPQLMYTLGSNLLFKMPGANQDPFKF